MNLVIYVWFAFVFELWQFYINKLKTQLLIHFAISFFKLSTISPHSCLLLLCLTSVSPTDLLHGFSALLFSVTGSLFTVTYTRVPCVFLYFACVCTEYFCEVWVVTHFPLAYGSDCPCHRQVQKKGPYFSICHHFLFEGLMWRQTTLYTARVVRSDEQGLFG